jgi:ligand-binding SRPBCC domain-containing protein
MKIYHLKRVQFLPISIQQAWDFFSTPKNLGLITPPEMNFEIKHISGSEKMYAGQIIRYRVRIKSWLTVDWMTEITQVNAPYHFIDSQVSGPYKLWHHQHHFKEVNGGVEMTDELHYAIPYGFVGRIANAVFVAREVNAIFDYRYKVLETYFVKERPGIPAAV